MKILTTDNVFQLSGAEIWPTHSSSCFNGFLTSNGPLHGFVSYMYLLGYILHISYISDEQHKSTKAQSPFFLPNLTGIVLYAPALALSAVTGLHFEGAVIGIGDISSYIISLLSIMILNVSKLLKYILRYILSESWYLFYKCLDYSWCRQNTKKTEKKNFHRIGLHLLLNSWRYEGCPHDRPLPGESNNQYTRSQIINMLFLNSYSPAPQFQSLLMFAAVFSVAGCSLWDAGLEEIIDTANRNGSSN